ncbi:MAG: RNA 2',3'-cyclic phosphodiesterase [Acidimicrobiia bacterium]
MSTTGRAFVAVVPPPEVLDAIGAAVGPLRERMGQVRWAPRKQWHITLQFLGNHVDLDATARALGEGLDAAAGPARLGSAGAIPSERRGRLLWIGVEQGTELLAQLASAVADIMRPLGVEPDRDRFHAHLTVARMKRPADLSAPVAALRAAHIGPEWPMNEIVLVRSLTKPTGAEYETIARVALSG